MIFYSRPVSNVFDLMARRSQDEYPHVGAAIINAVAIYGDARVLATPTAPRPPRETTNPVKTLSVMWLASTTAYSRTDRLIRCDRQDKTSIGMVIGAGKSAHPRA